MAQELTSGPIQIGHGHTDEHVFVQFTRPTNDLVLSIAQAEAFIKAMQESIQRLKVHMEKKAGH
jgi:hypothetical protein